MSFDIKFQIEDILVEELDLILEEYSCSCCFELIYGKKTLQCINGHWNCKQCWINHLNKNKTCMTCRCQVSSIDDLSRCRVIEKGFSSKKVCCPNSFKYNNGSDEASLSPSSATVSSTTLVKDTQNGCQKIIKVDELETHLQECQHRFTNCSNQRCDQTMRSNELEQHLAEQCEWVYQNCQYCSASKILKTYMPLHYTVCQRIIIKCPLCSMDLERCELESHQEETCSGADIPCKYKEYGCNALLKKADLPLHLQQASHVQFMGNIIDKQSVQLEEQSREIKRQANEITRQTKEITDSSKMYQQLLRRFDQMDERLMQMDETQERYSNSWTISNFSSLTRVGESHSTPTIRIGDCKFKIELFPHGSGDQEVGPRPTDRYCSVFLDELRNKSVRVKFNCTITNLHSENNIERRIESGNVSKFVKTGWNRMYKSTDILNKSNGWLRNDDKLIIDFTILVLKSSDIHPPLETNGV